jgi:hypothetical protein
MPGTSTARAHGYRDRIIHENRTVLYTVQGFFATHNQRKMEVGAGQSENKSACAQMC